MNLIYLNILKHKRIGNCTKCDLYKTRKNLVFGEGSSDADLMIVGEAPGESEDEQGRPFVGRSGKLLDEWLGHVGLRRCDVFIANVLKCRPPKNRNPNPEEIETCSPFLKKQIKIIQPKSIIALGKFAGHLLCGHKMLSLSDMRDMELSYEGKPLFVTYHPSYVLRREGKFDSNGPANSKVLSDIKRAIKFDKMNA